MIWISRIVCLIAAIVGAIGVLVTPATAERVVSLSSDGTIRMLQNPDCVESDCRWVDIDRNSRSTALTASSDNIYQLHSTGSIWRWDGRPCADGSCPSWTKIDQNSEAIAISAGYTNLFQLHRNGSLWRHTGEECESGRCPGWRRIDKNPRTKSIIAAGDQLFQLHDNGSIWRWRGEDCERERCSSWQQLDHNPKTVEIDFAARGTLVQRHRNGSLWRWNGQPCDARGCRSWSQIDRNPATVDILAAPGNLFQHHDSGSIWRWQGHTCEGIDCRFWTRIGAIDDLLTIAAGPQPYADEFTGEGGGAAPVYAVNGNGQVVRWDGTDCRERTCPQWDSLAGAFSHFRRNRSKFYVFPGNPPDPDSRLVVIPAFANDADGDGLPDEWEARQTDLDVRPDRADIIIVVAMRPELASNPALQTTLRENLNRAKEFFADLPVRTERGSRGIHLTVESARPLDSSFSEAADPVRPYQEARSLAMPPDLVGYGHGMLFDINTGGGGQTSGMDWSAQGMDWRTIVHELGHQLGLSHEPRGSGVASPLYLSLMNYDYNYGIAGDGNNIRFSDGRFASFRLDERNLNEVLPFAVEQLDFLTYAPYDFNVERVDHGSASVDWNRNGIHRERNIAADINDGYGLVVGRWNHVGYTDGGVAVASTGDKFVVIRPDNGLADQEDYAGFGPTPDSPALLKATILRDREVLNEGPLVRTAIVSGSPTALEVPGGILVAAPSVLGSIQLGFFSVRADGSLSGDMHSEPVGGHREVVLVRTAAGADVILWDSVTKRITARAVTPGSWTLGAERPVLGPDGSSALLSFGPPGATYNNRIGQIVLLTSENDGRVAGRLKLRPLRSGERYVAERGRWLADPDTRSLDRPAIVFDGHPRAGAEGRYLVYYREVLEGPNRIRRMGFVRAYISSRAGEVSEAPYVFRRRRVINEWVHSRNAPAVAPYRDDFVMAWRIPEFEWKNRASYNETEVNLYASGEFSSGPADFDDITFLAERGLRRIATVRP